MSKTKILVVEDEIIIADNLCDILYNLGYECLEPAINYTEAIEILKKTEPDIAIIDIQLGGSKNGIDLAHHINKTYKFPFIFLTSNTDKLTIEKAKEVNPFSYLTKPFTKEGIYSSIEIALNMSKKVKHLNNDEQNFLFLKEKGNLIKILYQDISYLKSDHVYTELHLINGSIKVFRIGLNTIIEKLNTNFIRVHRSYIINYKHITKIYSNAVLINNKTIPIGAKYKLNLHKFYL